MGRSAARPGRRIDRALAAARDQGLTRLPEIARLASPEVGIPEAECLSYLRDNLEFHLGPRQQEGLERFYQLAKQHGLAQGHLLPEAIRKVWSVIWAIEARRASKESAYRAV